MAQEATKRTFYANVIAKRDGMNFGFSAEWEAATWAEAFAAIKSDLQSRGWFNFTVRKSA